MSIEGRIYEDIASHQADHDRIVAIVMNHRLMADLMNEMTGPFGPIYRVFYGQESAYKIMGYNLVLMREIPDGEWLVVVEDRYPSVSFMDWYKWEADEHR